MSNLSSHDFGEWFLDRVLGAFFDYLREVDCSDVEVYSIPEGSVVFPKVPLMRVEGPVAGPDGAISASKYCFMGGFDATSNVLAGNLFGIPLRGTHSHAFVSSYMVMRSGIPNFCAVALALHDLGYVICPLMLITCVSGHSPILHGNVMYSKEKEKINKTQMMLNFINRSHQYKASGIRLDSGDLAYLSIEARKVFRAVEKEFNVPGFGRMVITASNDLNEETIDALNNR
ncbi:hypothetical protein HU200_027244 [Digitaria exilis]|uniref:nicotinate phosphoribosyltransferase n=1 Tax=Digitaria exilis TaxID=1010633 RepID=A0A835ETR0_9POAL|nr:hypothetical protein HU200_027244 [Digitaria exilis]